MDFAGFIAALRSHGYNGWVSLDFDPLRPGEGSISESMAFRRKYLIDNLHASLRDVKAIN